MTPSPPSGCIFCEIVAGTAPASVVHEDEAIIAFLDIRPVTPGHLLVIPKRHAAYLADLDEVTGGRMFTVAMRLATALRASDPEIRCEGVNLFLADGEVAFQEVFHTHLHVFPRFTGDTFGISADWSQAPSRDELDRIAAIVSAVRFGQETFGEPARSESGVVSRESGAAYRQPEARSQKPEADS